MKPLFTVHAGEFLAAEEIERRFSHLDVWLPTRDVGVDLLVTDPKSEGKVSFQVKYSKDFRVTHVAAELQSDLRACGWWTLTRSKIENSPADYWVFVLYGLARGSVDYVVIPPRELLQRLDEIHGEHTRYQSYLWTTEQNRCFETRGLKREDQTLVASGGFYSEARDFTQYLGDWSCLEAFRERSG